MFGTRSRELQVAKTPHEGSRGRRVALRRKAVMSQWVGANHHTYVPCVLLASHLTCLKSIFMINLRSRGSFISTDRQFSRKSRSRERDGYQPTAKRKRATIVGLMKEAFMSCKSFHLVYQDEKNTRVVMDIILKHGIKAKRREHVCGPSKTYVRLRLIHKIFKELWTNGELHELTSIQLTRPPWLSSSCLSSLLSL